MHLIEDRPQDSKVHLTTPEAG